MMALPHAQYVIAEASTPVSGVNSNQVKTVSNIEIHRSPFHLISISFDLIWILCILQTHYVISDGQTELETKQTVEPQDAAQAPSEQLEQQTPSQPTTTQYIITTTTNGSSASEVHASKP